MAQILIVDDSKTSRKILKEVLEQMGHQVVGEAANGEEGFLMYQQVKPELVTMDITMPKLDGLEALQLIKNYDEHAKIVMITAAGQKEKVLKAIKCGAIEFISKPIDEVEIENKLRNLLTN